LINKLKLNRTSFSQLFYFLSALWLLLCFVLKLSVWLTLDDILVCMHAHLFREGESFHALHADPTQEAGATTSI
jgi:hypothetical protein